jgi:hypothetical protein
MDEFKKISSAYFHINNGGINFGILNRKSEYDVLGKNYTTEVPTLRIGANHSGIKTNEMDIPMSSYDMRKLGEWLIENSKKCEEFEKLKDCYVPTIENGFNID